MASSLSYFQRFRRGNDRLEAYPTDLFAASTSEGEVSLRYHAESRGDMRSLTSLLLIAGWAMSEELFDVVDELDRLVEVLPRSVVHARKLLHRAVHVFVFNSRGELLIQMRSATKDESPLTYTSSASGHVSAGDTYAETAPRELLEEIGLRASLHFVTKLAASIDLAWEHTVLYEAVCDDEPRPDPVECAGVEWTTLANLDVRMEAELERFSWPFVTLYRWYRVHHQPPIPALEGC